MHIKKETYENAINLLAMMVIEEISRKECRDPSDVLPEFLASDTAALLFDETSKFWWSGPSAIADNYRQEQARKAEAAAGNAETGPQDAS